MLILYYNYPSALHEMAQLEWLLRQTPSRESRRTEKSTIYNFLRVDANDDSLDANIQVANAAGQLATFSFKRT